MLVHAWDKSRVFHSRHSLTHSLSLTSCYLSLLPLHFAGTQPTYCCLPLPHELLPAFARLAVSRLDWRPFFPVTLQPYLPLLRALLPAFALRAFASRTPTCLCLICLCFTYCCIQPTPSALPTLTPQPQTSSIPSPSQSRLALGPRWGATEGGRDSLGWVRGLARHGERSPLYQTGVEEMGSLEGAVPEGPRRNVLPSLRTDRREDVGLLSQWLEGMVAQLSSHDARRVAGLAASTPAPPPPPNALPHPTAATLQQQALSRPTTPGTDNRGGRESPGGPPLSRPGSAGREAAPAPQGPSSALELADGVLHVYDVAMEELKMQVSSECRERGVLMGILWEQVKGVLELRAGLEAESRLGAMQLLRSAVRAQASSVTDSYFSIRNEAHACAALNGSCIRISAARHLSVTNEAHASPGPLRDAAASGSLQLVVCPSPTRPMQAQALSEMQLYPDLCSLSLSITNEAHACAALSRSCIQGFAACNLPAPMRPKQAQAQSHGYIQISAAFHLSVINGAHACAALSRSCIRNSAQLVSVLHQRGPCMRSSESQLHPELCSL
ncbi:hypothetical protein DUNSADRAFT_10034 [Dunaliella salina]|uniref:Uncharacterized protein n=1 Tax=Dunaliella salina TaxID=3046 RepID=A0ABQ7GG53_DUNSA|nr:hypothetical protein DUNSADRAFT_10034 [Dunaliella salina]|eukprot:KAF5833582.1 hypothetical protein DUNSADRAFT_10034 [Dunaliella salina]